MKRLTLAILIICLPLVSADLMISEFLPNPLGSDDAPKPGGEWVELYNNKSTETILDNCILYDSSDDHELYIINETIKPNSFLVVYRDEDGDFTLNNKGDTIRLFCNRTLKDSVSYEKSSEGMSIALTKFGWQFQQPSPAQKNFQPSSNWNGCDWQVQILMNKTIFDDKPNFRIVVSKNFGEKNNLTLSRQIGDVDGKIVKPYKNLTLELTKKKTLNYNPELKNGNAYLITAAINSLNCNDTNLENNAAQKLIFVKTENYSKEQKNFSSSIKIIEIKPNKTKFGQTIYAKINIYKGDTKKRSIKVYVENISEITKTDIYHKFINQTITLPIQLKPNCKNKHENATYKIIAEGLETSDEKMIRVEGINKEACQQKIITKESDTFSEKIINQKQPKKENTTVYESKKEKTKKLAIYAFSTLLILLIIALVKKW